MRTPLSSQYTRCFSGDFLFRLVGIETSIEVTKQSILDIKKIIARITPPQSSENKNPPSLNISTISQNSPQEDKFYSTTRLLYYKHSSLVKKNRELYQKRADLFSKHFPPET